MSGAGSIKGDGSDENRVYEVKDANKSFTVSLNDVITLYTQAAKRGKEGVLVIEFPGYTVEATITKKMR